MDFYPPEESFDQNLGQNLVWKNVKLAFANQEGFGYYRYPVYNKNGFLQCEPDILLGFRDHGIFIIECKGLRIENIHVVNIQD